MANANETTIAIDPMHEEQPGHGNSVAAWATVGVMLLGFAIGCVGYTIASVPVVIAGVVVILVGLLVGWVLKKLGYGVGGSKSKSAH